MQTIEICVICLDVTLTSVNVIECQNDVQMRKLREYYLRTLDYDIIDFK